MKILLDMNLSPEWTEALQRLGHEAIHWSTVGNAKATDREITQWALDGGYIVFTHDLDFGAILAATQANGPSVIQLRTQDPKAARLILTLGEALRKFEAALLAGAIVVIDESHARVRILPLNR